MKELRELQLEVVREWQNIPAIYRLPLMPLITPLLKLLNGILDRLEVDRGKEESG